MTPWLRETNALIQNIVEDIRRDHDWSQARTHTNEVLERISAALGKNQGQLEDPKRRPVADAVACLSAAQSHIARNEVTEAAGCLHQAFRIGEPVLDQVEAARAQQTVHNTDVLYDTAIGEHILNKQETEAFRNLHFESLDVDQLVALADEFEIEIEFGDGQPETVEEAARQLVDGVMSDRDEYDLVERDGQWRWSWKADAIGDDEDGGQASAETPQTPAAEANAGAGGNQTTDAADGQASDQGAQNSEGVAKAAQTLASAQDGTELFDKAVARLKLDKANRDELHRVADDLNVDVARNLSRDNTESALRGALGQAFQAETIGIIFDDEGEPALMPIDDPEE